MLTTFTQNLRAEFEALKAKIKAGAEADLAALESHIVSIEEVLGLREAAREAPAVPAVPTPEEVKP